ncbi:efflux RND transporter permease subunit [Neptunomonas japonica]|uniref:efflux RND transporter permease subunit n=1 Tax=Neptunomonas japonica TaxID=417574 RepID=UPI00040309B9|nr:efflux RND transporter permease subunit [Neptunomonas japonica]
MSKVTSKGWVAWFASNPVAANLLMALILVAGVISALNLRVEAFPPLPPNSVSISVEYDTGSARSVEEGVTSKIEEALQGVQGIKTVTSTSNTSSASITVNRTSGYDLDTLYRDVKNRVDGIATLPNDAERPIISREIYLEDAVSVHLAGDVPQDVLQQSARTLRKKLLNNPAIERVNSNGRHTPEISIQVNEQQLQALELTIRDIADKVAASSLTVAGGELFSKDGYLIVKADQQRYQLRDFESILIKQTQSGQRLTLADIATVKDAYEQSGVLSRFNGERAIWLDVKMYSSSDIMEISTAVQKEVKHFRLTQPDSIQITVWNDQSIYIANRLNLLLKNSIMGIALVMLLLALFLNVRVAFWVGAGLPVIFAGAMLLMDARLFNMTLNELTTFGFIIALGIVVDDAVVVGESIYTERQRHGASLNSTISGAQRVAVPTVFGVLTTVVAFMALTLVEGEMGKIFSFFAYAAAFCLIFSLIESKLILPAHLAHLKMENKSAKNPISKGWGWLQKKTNQGLRFFTRKIYRPFIHQVLNFRYTTVLLAIALFILVGGLVPSGKIRSVFFPDIPSDFIEVQLELEDQAGYGLVQAQALEIEQIAMQVNRQLQEKHQLSSEPIPHLMTLTGNTSATIIAGLSPRTERPLSTSEIADLWQQKISAMEAVRKLKFVTAWEGAADITIELRSESAQTLKQASPLVQNALAQFSGVSGIENSIKAGQAQIDLKLLPAGEAMGLTTAMLAQQIQQAYQGYEIQRIQRGRDEVKVKVSYPDEQRRRIEDLEQARIRTPNGQIVQLRTVAHISTRYVSDEIEHIDRSRVAYISADLDKMVASPTEVLNSLDKQLLTQLQQDYPDLTVTFAGEAQEEAETTGSLKGAFLVALIAIYALLAIPLKSYIQPLMIMSAIPFGVIGALLGHWLHGIPLSLLSMFGILALSGVVVNDSLLLISRYNENRAAGKPARLAMIEAGCGRMRAIILTSITTYAGLVPLIWETAENAQFLIPAAVAMGYGILFATLITLLLIPALVLISDDLNIRHWLAQRKARQLKADIAL